VTEKPRDAVVKFDTYRNVQLAASRGLPCDSVRGFLFTFHIFTVRCYAEWGYATVCRLSSVCPSVDL